MGLFSILGFGNGAIKEALRKGAVVIDVRTAAEFDRGHVADALNIPVDRVGTFSERIKSMNKPVIFCCDTGERSSRAKQDLLAKGMKEKVYNGGSWQRVLKLAKSV